MTMTKREEVFYKNLIISDEDKIRAEKSLKSTLGMLNMV